MADRGFPSEANRRHLRSGEHAYIVGEELRSGSPQIKAALSRQGRYQDIAESMRVKEVRINDTERFVICHTPEAAERGQHMRTQLVAQLEELIADTAKLSDFERGERCSDPHLSAGDIALGYKQLLEVERGRRDMKQVIDLRPVYHRLEERIRAHVALCPVRSVPGSLSC